jgi:hypothetical protein
MPYLAGIILALSVSGLATRIGLDRDRAFPRSGTLVMTGFLLVALIGFKKNLWLVVAGLAAHGVFDIFHGRVVANPGVPAWWPAFCLTYDITAAAFLAWLLGRSHHTSVSSSGQ